MRGAAERIDWESYEPPRVHRHRVGDRGHP